MGVCVHSSFICAYVVVVGVCVCVCVCACMDMFHPSVHDHYYLNKMDAIACHALWLCYRDMTVSLSPQPA